MFTKAIEEADPCKRMYQVSDLTDFVYSRYIGILKKANDFRDKAKGNKQCFSAWKGIKQEFPNQVWYWMILMKWRYARMGKLKGGKVVNNKA